PPARTVGLPVAHPTERPSPVRRVTAPSAVRRTGRGREAHGEGGRARPGEGGQVRPPSGNRCRTPVGVPVDCPRRGGPCPPPHIPHEARSRPPWETGPVPRSAAGPSGHGC